MKTTMIMAVSADGRIAKHKDHFPDWTSREDKKFFAEKSKEAGVVIMGDATFDTFPAPLKDRLNVVFTRDKNRPQISNVKWVAGDPKKVLAALEKDGYQEAVLGGGSVINGLFLKNHLVDEMMITVEPKIFGNGISLFNGEFDQDLKLMDVEKLNADSLVIKYQISNNN